jgi:ribonuclease P protein subunit POP4
MKKMKKKALYPHELIGELIEIVTSKNLANLSLRGKVVDETKMTIKIECGQNIKTLFKHNITIKLVRTGQIIQGDEIAKRPEERLKGK